MRRTAILLNSIVFVFFICFLGYTFMARQHLDGLARRFVTEKTLEYSKPIVDVADEALDAPLVQKLLPAEHSAAIRVEIDEYRKDPPAYIADLSRQKQLPAKPEKMHPLLAKVASIKERIRTFYDNTLAALIADLRIFATSNLCAGLIAVWLAYRSGESSQRAIVCFSLLMFVEVVYCSYLYVDDLTFFRILFRTHMGWWYPVCLFAVLIRIYWITLPGSVGAGQAPRA